MAEVYEADGVTSGTQQAKDVENSELWLPNSVENDALIVKSSVLSPPKTRGGHAPWKPGETGNPNGRPKKRDEEAAMAAIHAGAPPERITLALNTMFDLAVQYKSWKAWEAYLKLALPYVAGLPIQRIEQQTNALAAIFDAMQASRTQAD